MVIPIGFSRIRSSGYHCVIRDDVRPWLDPAIARLEDCARLPPARGGAGVLVGGRGGVVLMRVDTHTVVVRPCRRGGLPARFVRDVYFGLRPRPFAELVQTERLRQAGVPVVEIYAAVVAWLVPGCYQGWVLSRFLEGTETLWTWAQREHEPGAKQEVWRSLALALRRLHAAGVVHPDLNLQNVLVRTDPGGAQVWLIDFDRKAIAARIGSDIERLERSVRKLDPQRQHIRGEDFAFLRRAYAEAPCD